jgi:hypothetical protein
MTFPQFWCHYLKSHSQAGTRGLHYAGTGIGFVGIIVALFKENFWIALLGMVTAFVFAWTGHFLFEKNRPCVIQHPVWSFFSDVRMVRAWLTRRLDSEFRNCDFRGST